MIGSSVARCPERAVRALHEDALWPQLHSLLEPLGFSRWSYCAVPTCYALGPPEPVRIITYPEGWVREFVKRGFAAYSPVLAYAMAHQGPGDFSQIGDQGIRAVRLRELLELNHGFGVTNGFVLTLRRGLGMTGALALVFDGDARDCARTLTDRQLDVVRLLALGLGSAAIAESLGVSIHTVDKHVALAKRTLGVRSSAQLTAMSLRWGLIA
jgi:DNA-binding CsgD family transcriptional regulator